MYEHRGPKYNEPTINAMRAAKAKTKMEKRWLGYVATIVQHLCDTKGVGHTVAVAIAESYTYTKAKQFAQRIKRGEA
jgi:hypothetical protein